VKVTQVYSSISSDYWTTDVKSTNRITETPPWLTTSRQRPRYGTLDKIEMELSYLLILYPADKFRDRFRDGA
jgi:hypothetical protein